MSGYNAVDAYLEERNQNLRTILDNDICSMAADTPMGNTFKNH